MSGVSLDCIYPHGTWKGNFGGLITKDFIGILRKGKDFNWLIENYKKKNNKKAVERLKATKKLFGKAKTLEEWAKDEGINQPEWFIGIGCLDHFSYYSLELPELKKTHPRNKSEARCPFCLDMGG
jgi:hypothetical protein